jgi:hypothetical protein
MRGMDALQIVLAPIVLFMFLYGLFRAGGYGEARWINETHNTPMFLMLDRIWIVLAIVLGMVLIADRLLG